MLAVDEWPFLAGIELPYGMVWQIFGDDPAIKVVKSNLFLGWVNGKCPPASLWLATWSYAESLPAGTTLEQACHALANYAWCLGDIT